MNKKTKTLYAIILGFRDEAYTLSNVAEPNELLQVMYFNLI